MNQTEETLEFDWIVQFYSIGTEVEIQENVNAIFVINLSPVGGAIVTVNNFPLNPALVAGANGESFIIGGNKREIIKRKQLNIGFSAAGGRCAVVQKYYVNFCK